MTKEEVLQRVKEKQIIPIEEVKKYLEEFELDARQKFNLISATGDTEFIKQCINNNDLRLQSFQKFILIQKIGDIEYIKQCIDNQELGLSSREKFDLIKVVGDIDYIKQCISNEDLGLSSSEKADLIEATGDIEYIKQCISNNDIKLNAFNKGILIRKTEDVDYMKQCVSNEELGLTTSQKYSLIIATKDAEYIKQYIDNEKLVLSINEKCNLIKATGDTEYIKQCISNRKLGLSIDNKYDLIKATEDTEYIKQCINSRELGLSTSQQYDLIKAIGNTEYIKQCIDSRELGLSISQQYDLIKSIKDINYIKQFIANNELSFKMQYELIESTQNSEFIKQCIQNESIDKDVRNALMFITNQNRFYEEHKIKDNDLRIELPPEMTIGIEIESEGVCSQCIDKMDYKGWNAKEDATLISGVEVVSPILKPTEEESQDIYAVCGMLKEMGQSTSERCGGHIHIGANYLTSKESYANLLAIWGNAEKVIYEISNPSGEHLRNGAVLAGAYASPISGKLEKAIEEGTLNLASEQDLDEFISQLKKVQEDRYSGINFANIGKGEIGTIEFRISNGTINPKTWIENINLFGGIVKAAEEITKINQKPQEIQTKEEQRKLESFERLCGGELEEKEILDELLRLSVSKKNKDIYEQRYEANKMLYKDNPEIEEAMKKATTKSPIKPKDIGKGTLLGDNSVTSIEILDASTRLSLDRSRVERAEIR